MNEIARSLDRLLWECARFMSKPRRLAGIFRFAAYFHNQFQHIHLFLDGNSRTACLLTFHLLHYFHIPVADIPLGLLDEYVQNTKGYRQRDDAALEQTLQLIALHNLKTINEKLS